MQIRSWNIILAALIVCSVALAAKPDKAKDQEKKGAEHDVAIKSVKFTPATLDIKVGDTVVWTNNDDLDHTVVADDDSFKSENIGHGQTFKYTFKKKGKFKYSCSYHPRMKGTITVSD